MKERENQEVTKHIKFPPSPLNKKKEKENSISLINILIGKKTMEIIVICLLSRSCN